MSYELLLFDADGTLLGSDGRVRPASARLIADLAAANVRVGLATGRSPRSIKSFLGQLPALSGPCVLFNGGMVWDVSRAAPIWERQLPLDDALSVVQIAAELGMHINLYVGEELLIAERSRISEASEKKDGVPHTVVGDLVRYLKQRGIAPYKLLLIHESGDFRELLRRCDAALEAPCTLVNSEPTYMELLPVGVCKGAALAAVEAHYGIAAERVIAFGDGKNDIELLQQAGLGVAMGNAHPELRAHADIVIGHNDEDAIADFVRSRFVIANGRLVQQDGKA